MTALAVASIVVVGLSVPSLAGAASTRVGTAANGVAVTASGDAYAVGKSDGDMLVQRVSAAGQTSTPLSAGTGVGRAATVQTDGKLLVAGSDNGFVVRRFNVDGTIDSGWGNGGTARAPSGAANAITLGACGAIYAAGSITGADGFPQAAVARFLADGRLDSTFGTAGVATVNIPRNSRVRGITLQGDNLVVVGDTSPFLQAVDAFIMRLRPDGSQDPAFNGGDPFYYYHPQGGANSSFSAVTTDTAGRIVAGGADVTGNGPFAVFARLGTDGRADASFGTGGISSISAGTASSVPVGVSGIAIAGDRIVASGAFQNSGLRLPALYVLTGSGDADGSVGSGGVERQEQLDNGNQANGLAIAPDGSIVLAGETFNFIGNPSGYVSRRSGLGAPLARPVCSGAAAVTSLLTGVIAGVTSPPASSQASPSTTPTPGSGGTNPSATPSAKPKASKVKLSSSTITPKRSATLRFTVSKQARVRISLEQRLTGRARKGKCGKASSANRGGARCTYYQSAGSTQVTAKAGKTTSLTIASKFGSRRLAVGKYRLTLAVTGGNSVRLNLTVKAK